MADFRFRVGSLCTGYGGIELALESLISADLRFTADIDKGANLIISHRFPKIPNLGDLAKIDWNAVIAEYGEIDILTAGFPCQDVSQAGGRAGLRENTRTGVWYQVARAIDSLQPNLILLENVRGLLSAGADSTVEQCPWCLGEGGAEHPLRALGAVLADLSDLGFDADWVTVSASDIGAPHRRERVFIAAYPQGERWWLGGGPGREGRAGQFERVRSAEPVTGNYFAADPGRGRVQCIRGPATVDDPDGKRWWYVGSKHRDGSQDDRGKQDGSAADADFAAKRAVAVETGGGLVAAVEGDPESGRDRDGEHADAADPAGVGSQGFWGDAWQDGSSDWEDLPGFGDGFAGTGGNGAAADPGRWSLPEGNQDFGPAAEDSRGSAGNAERPGLERVPVGCVGRSGVAAPRHLAASYPGYWDDTERARQEGREAGERAPVGDGSGSDINWGRYEPAIRQWEAIIGRPAPRPAVPSGRDGKLRLNPVFPEWMMGLPEGWVTDVPGLGRMGQLKAIGNGVCPQQAMLAFRMLLGEVCDLDTVAVRLLDCTRSRMAVPPAHPPASPRPYPQAPANAGRETTRGTRRTASTCV